MRKGLFWLSIEIKTWANGRNDQEEWIMVEFGAELTLITSPLCRPAPSLGFYGTTCSCISFHRLNNCFSISSWVFFFLILKCIKVPLKEGSLSDKIIHYNIPPAWHQSSPTFASTTRLHLGFATKAGFPWNTLALPQLGTLLSIL